MGFNTVIYVLFFCTSLNEKSNTKQKGFISILRTSFYASTSGLIKNDAASSISSVTSSRLKGLLVNEVSILDILARIAVRFRIATGLSSEGLVGRRRCDSITVGKMVCRYKKKFQKLWYGKLYSVRKRSSMSNEKKNFKWHFSKIVNSCSTRV